MGVLVRKGARKPNLALRVFSLIYHVRKALEGQDVKDLLLNVGSGGGGAAAAAPAAGGAAGGGAAAKEAPKEEEKEEGGTATLKRPPLSAPQFADPIRTEKEESDEDMGFGLFD